MKKLKTSEKPLGVYVDEEGNTVVDKKPKWFGIGTKIFCVVAAFLLWLYVSGDQTFEKTFDNVPVSMEGESSISALGLEAISRSEAVASVTVTGKRSQINSLEASDLYTHVSLKGITSSQQYTLPVKVSTPVGVSVASVTPEAVNVYIDRMKLETVPVTAEIISGGVKDTPLSDASVVLDINEVTVEGPSAIVSTVSEAVAELDLGGIISSSVDISGVIHLVDESGNQIESEYLTITPSSVNAHIPVFSSKTVRVVPDFTGSESAEYSFEVTPSTIVVKSEDAKLLSGIEKISTLPITVDAGTIGSSMYSLVIPDGIELVTDIESVEVKVSAYSEVNLDVKNIFFLNLAETLEVKEKPEYCTVKFIGSASALSEIKEGDFYAIADLAKYAEPGLYNVPVSIDSTNGGDYHADGTYFVKLLIIERSAG